MSTQRPTVPAPPAEHPPRSPSAAPGAALLTREAGGDTSGSARTPRGAHDPNLDILRAVATIAVFFTHAATHFAADVPFMGRDGGWFGVQLFFLLSGYLIIGSASRYPWRTYWTHRVLRLWPAYLVVFLVGGAMRHAVTPGRIARHPAEFVANLLLLGQFWPSARGAFPVLVVAWTLTVELCWYAFAPLAVRTTKKWPWWWVGATCVLTTAWVTAARAGRLDFLLGGKATQEWQWLYLNNAFPAQLCFFVVGAALRWRGEVLRRINPLLAVGLLVIFGMNPHAQAWWAWLDTPTFLSAIGIGALFALALGSPPLRATFLRFVAKISYSVYLTHHLVIDYLRDHTAWRGGVGVAASAVVTLALSTALFYAVEQPAMRLARRWN